MAESATSAAPAGAAAAGRGHGPRGRLVQPTHQMLLMLAEQAFALEEEPEQGDEADALLPPFEADAPPAPARALAETKAAAAASSSSSLSLAAAAAASWATTGESRETHGSRKRALGVVQIGYQGEPAMEGDAAQLHAQGGGQGREDEDRRARRGPRGAVPSSPAPAAARPMPMPKGEVVFRTPKLRGGSSKFVGVCWNKSNRRWQAEICVGGQSHHLGYFDVEEEAGRAYDAAAQRMRPEGLTKTTSKYRGVSYHQQCNRWRASIRTKGKLHYLGLFEDELEAAQAFEAAAAARQREKEGGSAVQKKRKKVR
jgi:hypothetical protein